MAQASKQKAASQHKKKQSLVYLGPNLSGGILIGQFSVFQNGLPGPIKERCQADPHFKRLFIPTKELATAREQLKRPGSLLDKAFRAVSRNPEGVKNV